TRTIYSLDEEGLRSQVHACARWSAHYFISDSPCTHGETSINPAATSTGTSLRLGWHLHGKAGRSGRASLSQRVRVMSRRSTDWQRERKFARADRKDLRGPVERPHRRRPFQKNSQENATRRPRPIDSAGKRRSGSFSAQVQQISFRQNRTATGQ